jgi:LysR family nitrogen assimilation transcriptional regulator
MQLRHLRYFVSIVEAGSFSRAAATIHVAQPALSQQIAELEDELGVSLLHRSARGVRPTVAGKTLYREASAILRQMEELPGKVRSIGGEISGAVNLGISSTLAAFLAGPFMEACHTALPKVALRLITGHSLLIKSRIEAKTLDIGVVFEDQAMPGFVRQPMFRQCLYLLRRGPVKRLPASVSLAELAKRPLVLPAHPNGIRILLDRVFNEAGIVPDMVAEADVLSGVLSAVQSGMGDTIVPKGDLSDVPGHTNIVSVPIEPPIFVTACLVSSGDAPLTGAGEAVRGLFTAFVANRFAESPLPGAEWIGGGSHSESI